MISVPEIMELAGIPVNEIQNDVQSDLQTEESEYMQERFYFSRPNVYRIDIKRIVLENRNK